MTRKSLFPPVFVPLLSCLLLLSAASPQTRAADKDAEKHPLEWLRPGTSLESGYLFLGVPFEDGLKAYSFSISKPEGADKITITIDPVKRKFNQFGDAAPANVSAFMKIPAILTRLGTCRGRLTGCQANTLRSVGSTTTAPRTFHTFRVRVA